MWHKCCAFHFYFIKNEIAQEQCSVRPCSAPLPASSFYSSWSFLTPSWWLTTPSACPWIAALKCLMELTDGALHFIVGVTWFLLPEQSDYNVTVLVVLILILPNYLLVPSCVSHYHRKCRPNDKEIFISSSSLLLYISISVQIFNLNFFHFHERNSCPVG